MPMIKFHEETSSSPLSAFTVTRRMLKSEKGAVLVVVIILSAVVLMVMSALLYMITSGTQISGMQKRYKTALEAAHGGQEILYDLIALRGDGTTTSAYLTALNTVPGVSTQPLGSCWGTKLSNLTTDWTGPGCNASLNINPDDSTTYDLTLQLGSPPNPSYTVYAKIVGTVPGNSGEESLDLNGDGTIKANGEISSGTPFLYAIEVLSQNTANVAERARLSILYQY